MISGQLSVIIEGIRGSDKWLVISETWSDQWSVISETWIDKWSVISEYFSDQ